MDKLQISGNWQPVFKSPAKNDYQVKHAATALRHPWSSLGPQLLRPSATRCPMSVMLSCWYNAIIELYEPGSWSLRLGQFKFFQLML
jgi:hypothetical protein